MSGGTTISTSETRAEALQLQSSAYGVTVPLVYGVSRIAGNMLWYGDFKAVPHTDVQQSGGKGGGVTTTTTTYTYTASVAMGLCEGPVAAVGRVWRGKRLYGAPAELGASAALGALGQSVWPYLASNFASQGLGYSGVAYFYAQDYNLGGSASIENHSVEVAGFGAYAAGSVYDANMAATAVDVLTNTRYGAAFPAGQIASTAAWSAYCALAGLNMSPALTEQTTAAEFLATACKLTNTAPVWTSSGLSFVPYGDTALSGLGVAYTPNVTPVYDLGDDDFCPAPGEDPVRVARTSPADALNSVRVEFKNRANGYAIEIAEAKDSASIDAYGPRPADVLQAHWICEAATARTVAQLLLQRALYIRNTYSFTLPWTKALLEPMDLVTITDAGLGYSKLAVRITEVSESDTGDLQLQAEDFPAGVATPALYTSQASAGYQHNYNAAPGVVMPPFIFEAPVERTTTGLEVYVALRGTSSAWGGCRVWVSLDGNNYKDAGMVYGGARYGTLAGPVAAGSLPVALNGGQLLSGSAADSANLSTLCYVGGATPEYFAYTTATLTGVNAYTLGSLTRSAYSSNTAAAAHSAGEPFARVDSAIAKSGPLDLGMVGKTIYFKFTSFNVYGQAEDSLAAVAAYGYKITGAMANLPPPDVATFTVDGLRLSWGGVAAVDLAGYELRYQFGSNTWWDSAIPLHTGIITDAPYVLSQAPQGQVTYLIKALDKLGNYSANAASVVANMGMGVVNNLFVNLPEAPVFGGAITGGSVVGGVLTATANDRVFEPADEPAFVAATALFFAGGTYTTLVYAWSALMPAPGILYLDVAATGQSYGVEYARGSQEAAFTPADALAFAPGTDLFFGAVSAWLDWPGTLALSSGETINMRITVAGGDTQGLVSALTLKLDVPDILESFNNLAVGSGGTRLPIAKTYRVIENVQVTVQADGNGGVTARVEDKNATLGPMLKVFNAAGTAVAGLIDAEIQGY